VKEFDKLPADKESAQHAHNKGLKHISTVAHQKGLKMYELDQNTKVVQEAKYEELFDMERKVLVKKIIVRPGCAYREFLNLKNAIKKFSRLR
jgi:hypothetical protein